MQIKFGNNFSEQLSNTFPKSIATEYQDYKNENEYVDQQVEYVKTVQDLVKQANRGTEYDDDRKDRGIREVQMRQGIIANILSAGFNLLNKNADTAHKDAETTQNLLRQLIKMGGQDPKV